MHNMTSMADVEAVYEGLETPDPGAERIGAFAALRDLRDGTNLTGLNPGEEKLIRHIGFSGHHSPPVMIEMMQRDEENLLDGMLIAINANDRLNFNMQHNAIPVATARNMGVIAMKVFADGAMYTKDAHFSRLPEHVVRTVGAPNLPSRPLVEYALSTPGVHTAIIGIGQIDTDEAQCQLSQNLSSAQIAPNSLSESDRAGIEQMAAVVKGGETNYFQIPSEPLSAPRSPELTQLQDDGKRIVQLTWQTAFAGSEPIVGYEIWRDNVKISEVAHRPQVSKEPFVYRDQPEDLSAHTYRLVTVDNSGGTAPSEDMISPPIG
jgi:hypothetical protein